MMQISHNNNGRRNTRATCSLAFHTSLLQRAINCRPRPGPLKYRDNDSEDIEVMTTCIPTSSTSSNLNLPKIVEIVKNQSLLWILIAVGTTTTALNGTAEPPMIASSNFWSTTFPFWYLDWNLNAVALGAVASIPMIFLSTQVEKSSDDPWLDLNASTNEVVMSTFGRRTKTVPARIESDGTLALFSEKRVPIDAVAASAFALASLTGVVEEIAFRGQIAGNWALAFHSYPSAILAQAFLFGIARLSLGAGLEKNLALASSRTCNGLWLGLTYFLSGGNLVPSIVAHVLHEFQVSFGTWVTYNDQLDHVEKNITSAPVTREGDKLRKKFKLSKEKLQDFRRFFFLHDFERKGSLSFSDVKKATHHDLRAKKVSERRLKELFDKFSSVGEGRLHFVGFVESMMRLEDPV